MSEIREDPAAIAKAIDALIGSGRVRTPRGRETLAARVIAEPRTSAEVSELVRMCEADRIALAAMGAARTLASIRREPAALGVAMTTMARVLAYEPDDMTVSVEAGITLGALNSRVGERRQQLALDPPGPDVTTIGAVVAAAQSGPLRLSEGTPRDLLIGVRFVGHDARLISSGGRVVKNVAGYDLMKVMTGSFGTLGIIVEATFKLRPMAEGYTIVMARFTSAAEAFAAARAALEALTPLHLEVVSPGVATMLGYPDSFLVIAGIAGVEREIQWQCERLAALLGNRVSVVTGFEASGLYARIRDLDFAAAAVAAKLSVIPAELGACLERCAVEFCAHAGSGVAEITIEREMDAGEAAATIARWRTIAHAARGNLRIVSAASALRGAFQMFDDPAPGALALMHRLKASFDPAGIFNPRCFVGGI